MDLRQLETFYWVSKLRSFSGAANHLNTTQPTISNRVQALESELGVSLFDRTTRQVSLTKSGHDIVAHAEQITKIIAQIRSARDRSEELTGMIRIGATNLVAHTWLPELIRRINEVLPNVDVDFEVDTMAALMSRFAARQCDLLIANREVVDLPNVVSRSLYSTTFDFVAHRNLDVGPSPVPLETLAKHRIMTYSRGTNLHSIVRNHLEVCSPDSLRLSGCNSLSAMILMANVQLCICAFPGAALATEPSSNLRILSVEKPLPSIDFFVSYFDDPFGQIAPAVADLATEICEENRTLL